MSEILFCPFGHKTLLSWRREVWAPSEGHPKEIHCWRCGAVWTLSRPPNPKWKMWKGDLIWREELEYVREHDPEFYEMIMKQQKEEE